MMKAGEGLIAHGQVHPVLFFHQALCMGEGLKARLTMVGPHAALPHPAKAHPGGSQMDDDIIDTAPSKGDLLHQTVDRLLVLGKKIEGQWLLFLMFPKKRYNPLCGIPLAGKGKNR